MAKATLVDGMFKKSSEIFDFVADEKLRDNLGLTLGYIIHLTLTYDVFRKDKVLHASIARDILVHTSSILEGLLFYCFEQLIENGDIEDWQEMCKKVRKPIPEKTIHKICDGEEIVLLIYKDIPYQKSELKANFVVLVEACRDIKILTPTLFEDVEKIRKSRKSIHLAGATKIINTKMSDAEESIEVLLRVVRRIKKKLNA